MKTSLMTALLVLLAACSKSGSRAGDGGGDGAARPDGAVRPAAVTPSPGTATVGEQIAQDLDDGTIDPKTAALYELLAQFSPLRLPAKYDVGRRFRGPPSVLPMLTAMAHLGEYGPVEKAAVQAMLASPEDPHWLVFPAEMPVRNFTEGQDSSCWQHYNVGEHGVGTSDFGSAISTGHFVIQPLAPSGFSVPGQPQLRERIEKAIRDGKLGDYLDSVYEKFKNDLKMKEPTSLKWVAAHDGKVPIFVGACDGDNQAFAHPDGFIFVSVQAAFDDPTFRRVVIPHELFHLFEYAYTKADYTDGSGTSQAWPYEAFAVAVEDLVAPDVRRWSGRFANSPLFDGGFPAMNRSFQCPEEPLHSVHEGRCKYRGAMPEPGAGWSRGDYGKFVLAKFLMRNKRLVPGDFWQKFAAANGNPQALVEETDAAEFQVALVGDPQGGSAYFDAGDRAAFFLAGQSSCDYDTDNTRRYTYWLDPAKIIASKLLRATPTDNSSRTVEALTRLDATPWPIMPWATHRLLVQVPREAAEGTDPYAGLVHVYLKLTNASLFSPSVVTFGEAGKPGRVFKADSVALGPLPDDHFLFLRGADGPLPGFVLLLVSNFGGAPLSYKGAVNFPNACTTRCRAYYDDEIAMQGCLQKWCWRNCSEPSTAAGCQDAMRKCIQKIDTSMSSSAEMEEGFFCGFLCWPPKDLAEPLRVPCNMACKICWDLKICGTTPCDADTPAGFYPIRDWPPMDCINWFAAGQARCP